MDDRPDAGDADNVRKDDLDQQQPSQPVFNLPRTLVVTIVVLAVIYLIDAYLLDEEMQTTVMIWFAFTPIRYLYPLHLQAYASVWTPVTYSLLHGNLQHIGFNALWLIAFGAPVVRRIGTLRYLLFWVFSAAASAFFHAALNWGDPTLLVGASGVISALMGAACRFAFPPRGGYDREFGHLYPRQSIFGAFRSRTVIIFTAMLLVGNALIAFGLPLMGDDVGPIAWDAHIGGFLFGFLFFALFDRLPVRAVVEDIPVSET